MYIFKKTCSNLARECVISDNNRKKLDESWTRPTFLQLNGWGENCQIFKNTLSNFYISIYLNPFKWIVYFTLYLMAHCVSQIATAFQNNGSIWLAVTFLVSKLAKLSLKGLTTLGGKKIVHGMQLHLFPEELHNSSSRHQNQQNLSNHRCVWTTLSSLEFSFHQIILT